MWGVASHACEACEDPGPQSWVLAGCLLPDGSSSFSTLRPRHAGIPLGRSAPAQRLVRLWPRSTFDNSNIYVFLIWIGVKEEANTDLWQRLGDGVFSDSSSLYCTCIDDMSRVQTPGRLHFTYISHNWYITDILQYWWLQLNLRALYTKPGKIKKNAYV